jgi:GNAT superfamily N-acetyltransferase
MLKNQLTFRIAKQEDYINLRTCVKDSLDLVDNFYENFLKDTYFILLAFIDGILVGVVIADKDLHTVDSIDKILPHISLKLLYIHPIYRKNNIGQKLFNQFIKLQKESGIATIEILLPQNYKSGLEYLKKFKFYERERFKNKIKLELNICQDFGVRSVDFLSNTFYNDNEPH